jgi:hypothetical protein
MTAPNGAADQVRANVTIGMRGSSMNPTPDCGYQPRKPSGADVLWWCGGCDEFHAASFPGIPPGCEPAPADSGEMPSRREILGRLVRKAWLTWARKQPDAKPSWLAPWEELGDGQREVDMIIGEAVAAAEQERILKRVQGYLDSIHEGSFNPATCAVEDVIRLIKMKDEQGKPVPTAGQQAVG